MDENDRFNDLAARYVQCDQDVFHSILNHVGDKWSLMLIGILIKHSRRFSELAASLPTISNRMLTVRLRQLERDGLIRRIVHADVPPWAEYEMTELGRTLREPVLDIAMWALDHSGEIEQSRTKYDKSTKQR